MGGFQHLAVAVQHPRDGPSAICRVALDVADQSLVGVGIDKDLEVHHVPELLVEEHHDTLDDDDRLRFDMDGLWQSVAQNIGVGRLLDGLALSQVVHLLDQQPPVEGVGVVEVDGLAGLVGHSRRIIIVRVERHDAHEVGWKCLCYLFDDGSLSRPCAASYSDDGNVMVHTLTDWIVRWMF